MSYLDTPRLTFCGTFLANVPTLNNFSPYFTTNYPHLGTGAGDWNTFGDCSFQIMKCLVRSVTDLNGTLSTIASDDPVIGAKVTTQSMGTHSIQRSHGSGKIVDLDTDQRRVTQLIGVKISIVLSETAWLTGTLKTCNLRDFWPLNAVPVPTNPAAPQSGVFQSVLHDLKWNGDLSSSKYLMSLKTVSDQNDNRASIKIILDNFVVGSDDPDVNLHGRVVGVIGPYTSGEPCQFVAERRLVKTFSNPSASQQPGSAFWHAPCRVDVARKKLILDLGNSVQWKQAGGESQTDCMWAAIMPSDADYMAGQVQPVILGLPAGSIPPAGSAGLTNGNPVAASKSAYETFGRISEIDLTPDELERLRDHRLCLLPPVYDPGPTPNSPPVLTKKVPKNPWPVLAEHHDGKYADVDNWVLRLNPGESDTVEMYARRFGQPLVGERLMFNLIDNPSTYVVVNTPRAALTNDFPDFAVTDETGHAKITFAARSGPITELPPTRVPTFAQVFQVGDITGWQAWGQVGPPIPPYLLASQNFPVDAKGPAVNILVFNEGPKIDNPEWKDVKDILALFCQLYPAMKEMIDLTDQAVVDQYAFKIYDALSRPHHDPYHMPATRDMSKYHRQLLLDYLKPLADKQQANATAAR